jgi:DNA integrity scanning protein DisA with diadenylate cyclase activity
MADGLLPSTVSATNTKSFWSRKEGKVGVLFAFGIGGVLLYALYRLLPFLIEMTQNLIQLALLGVVLFVIMFIILDPQVRNLAWYLYKAIMRWITGLFIQLDPVAIIETYVAHLRKQLEMLEDKIQTLAGARRKLKDAIDKAQEDMEEQLNLAKTGKKQGLDNAQIMVYTNQAGRLDASIQKFQNLLAKLETLYRILDKMKKNAGVVIMDYQNQVESIKQEREVIRTGFSAFKSAMSILSGDPDKKVLFDQAMEAIQNDISMKAGAMERFVEESSEIMQAIDLQNGAFEEKGMKLLEKWEKEGVPMLLTDGQSAAAASSTSAPKVTVSSSDGSDDNQYKSLLNK